MQVAPPVPQVVIPPPQVVIQQPAPQVVCIVDIRLHWHEHGYSALYSIRTKC